MWSNCFKYSTRCKLFCILLCLVIWRDLATMDENGYVKIIGRIKVCFSNISSLKHSKQQSLMSHSLMKIEDHFWSWIHAVNLEGSWKIFVKAPRGRGKFEKNPSEVLRSCFVGVYWNLFHPLEEELSKKNCCWLFSAQYPESYPESFRCGPFEGWHA